MLQFETMLQTVMLQMLAVPTLFTLTAVFYSWCYTGREANSSWSLFLSNFNSHLGKSVAVGLGSAISKLREWLMNRRTGRKAPANTPNSHIGECVVCFEEAYMVQLYPCQHSTLCLECVAEIITSGGGVCPLCRSQIQGYSEVFYLLVVCVVVFFVLVMLVKNLYNSFFI